MGNVCVGGAGPPEDAKRSKEIESQIKNEQKGQAAKKEVTLLLLGAAESGKSTIFKQMKLLQINGGFTKEELLAYRSVVYGNCLTQMKVLVRAAERLGLELQREDNKLRAPAVLDQPVGGESWNAQVAADIKALWEDPGIKAAYEKRGTHFHLNDSASYFFDNVDRFAATDYMPTEQDVLRSRIRTTGIEEARFSFEDLSFRMLDVGGQRNERRKWIHCFDGVTAVIFCVALSEYDQVLREDDSQNRMNESLLLFQELNNSVWFRDVSFVLFLNKTDLFREKIAKKDLTCCFPNYRGGCDYDKGVEFIQQKFIESNLAPHAIYPHLTCATNTDNIRIVFTSVRDTLRRQILNQLF